MNILAQTFQNYYTQEVAQRLQMKCLEYITPVTSSLSSLNYGEFVSSLSDTLHSLGRDILKDTFEEMDLAFRNSPNRTSLYYVKHTRPRTIVTVFGEVTYTRTEYISRSSGLPYCYVDRKIKLSSRQRYDSTVQSLIVEAYANHNSMIKVGQLIGNRIGSSYSLNSSSSTCIPRQTVFNILHRLQVIHQLPTPIPHTPEILYVMADEKYIPIQGSHHDNIHYPKAMIKAAVVFEGRRKLSKSASIPRYKLKNPYSYASTAPNFWVNLHDMLNQRYDLSKVKKIYLLGDGASWIKAGVQELSTHTTKVDFALDKFHAGQAIQRMTKDKLYTTLLTDTMIHNQRDEFKVIVDTLLEVSPKQLEVITTQRNYLLKHWNSIQTMYKTVKIGCAMEQAIQHILASVFSSVPKAYSKKHLETYVSNRVHYCNNLNLRQMILTAMDQEKNRDGSVTCKDSLDFSYFDTKSHNSTHSLYLRQRGYKQLYNF